MSIEGSASITDLVSCLWNCTSPQAAYICRLEENRDALRTALDELKELKNDTMRKVVIEEGRQMKRSDHVQGWFSRVDELKEDEVEQLLKDASQEIEKKCLGGCCPKNCKRSYKLGKRVAKKLEDVKDLKSKCNFVVVADEQPLPLVDKRPTEPTVGLKSTFDEVWSYIEDEQTGIIGIYGVGGVGKSTLLVEINNKFVDTTHGFDVVIWTVVSRNPSSIKVQEDIGKKIGFVEEAWKNKSQEEKTLDILRVLGEKKFVLLLDDIWEWFDLLNLGVPLPDQQINKSKVVFTTRSKEVCGSMGAHRKIEVKSLGWEEAWDLFQKKVGEETINSQSGIPELAKIVARECNGLPLALITIGRAMACKMTPQDWRHAITMLKKSAAEFAGMGDDVYHRLKFSYDNLQNNIIKSCFLYCSLFPEDYLISKKWLINYWIGEGFLDEFDDLNEARNLGHYIISTLTNACLLEEDSSYSVNIHDVIRDMVLWIACECGKAKNKVFVQARAGLTKAPEVEKWKEVERMSLMENKIEELSGTPSCPNLLTLLLNENNLQMITHGFFQNMPNLRVLDLSSNDNLNELPMEISELVSLRYLNLSETNIREFPIEFKKLVELKYLNLSYTRKLDIIPAGVLSSFKKLLVLDMLKCGSLEEEAGSGVEEYLVKEMELLKELNELSISIKTSSAFSRILSSLKLRSSTTCLSLEVFRGSEYLDISFLQSMTSLEFFMINDCTDLEDLRVERRREGLRNSEITRQLCFLNLTFVFIARCPMLKRELTWLIFAPNLETLWIKNCDEIEEVICCDGGKWSEGAKKVGYPSLFEKLQLLWLHDLPQLKSICPNALPFPCLEQIQMFDCPNLEKLPLNSDSAKGRKLVIEGSQDWWNDLEWEDEAARNAFLPSFRERNI